jgi:SAM-dependent methyltransferase
MNCRVCDSRHLELAIDLGSQPWCNHFLKKEEIGSEPFYPLHVVYCHKCATAQLDYTVKKEIMFGDHTYLSGITRSLDEHFKKVAEEVDSRFFKDTIGKSVLDIGSNDGTQLKHYRSLGYDVLGVESSKTTARIANDANINTLNEFFNLDLASRIGQRFHVINASGVFFHLEELHSVTEGIRHALRDEGVFVVQFLYMKQIIENLAFDQIYHEHLLYYNLQTIEVLLNQHGLTMFDAYLSPIHGGSIVGFVTHYGKKEPSDRLQALRKSELIEKSNEYSTYLDFYKRIQRMKVENLAFFEKAKQQGKHIYGFGAPVKGNTLLNYFGIGTQYIDCLVEKNELRRGLYSPGMHIPVVMEKDITDLPDIYYVLAWNFKKEILSNNQRLIKQGIEFYFPVNPKDA